jgi:diaminopimelate decarboxylase
MASNSPPFPATADFDGDRLVALGGCAVDDLAARFGTPLWVMDEADLRARMRAYREALGDGDVVYAAKACSVVAVLQLALAEGLAVDVASAGELAAAQAAGASPQRLVLHGNNKSAAELRAAADGAVGRTVVDDLGELAALAELGEQRVAAGRQPGAPASGQAGGPAGTPIDVWLRLTPGVAAGHHEAVRTGTDEQKFGLSIRGGLARQAVDTAVAAPGLALRGLHCHVGSGVVDPAAFEPAVDAMVGMLAEVRDRHGLELAELDLGGGLGVAEGWGDPEPSIAAYGKALRAAVEAAGAAHGVSPPRLAVEPGRSLVGPSGVTLYAVGSVKQIPGVGTYVAVDGGMSDNPRYALYRAAHPFTLAGRSAAKPAGEPVSVVGKHCEAGDVLAHHVALSGLPQPGGLLAAGAAGAYTQSMASTYNRVPRPAMVLVADGDARLVLRRETLDDLLRHDVAL